MLAKLKAAWWAFRVLFRFRKWEQEKPAMPTVPPGPDPFDPIDRGSG